MAKQFHVIDGCAKCQVFCNLAAHFGKYADTVGGKFYVHVLHQEYVRHLDEEHTAR